MAASGRLGQDRIGCVAGKQRVFAQLRMAIAAGVQHLRHRLDMGEVELVELFDVGENAIELVAILVHFLGREAEVSELSDTDHVFTADFHANYLSGSLWKCKGESPLGRVLISDSVCEAMFHRKA